MPSARTGLGRRCRAAIAGSRRRAGSPSPVSRADSTHFVARPLFSSTIKVVAVGIFRGEDIRWMTRPGPRARVRWVTTRGTGGKPGTSSYTRKRLSPLSSERRPCRRGRWRRGRGKGCRAHWRHHDGARSPPRCRRRRCRSSAAAAAARGSGRAVAHGGAPDSLCASLTSVALLHAHARGDSRYS
jgi:hypothetical protein